MAKKVVLALSFATLLILAGACANAESQTPSPKPDPATEAAKTFNRLCGFLAPLPEEGETLKPAVDACLERHGQMVEQRQQDVEARASDPQLMSQSGLREALHRDRLQWQAARKSVEQLEAAIEEMAKPDSTAHPEDSANPPTEPNSGS
jgi:hypothetical protein